MGKKSKPKQTSSVAVNRRASFDYHLGDETARNIRLLITKKQLHSLEKSKQLGNTIVPTKLFGGGRYIKIEVSLATGKKRYDKRVSIKNRDLDREARKRLHV